MKSKVLTALLACVMIFGAFACYAAETTVSYKLTIDENSLVATIDVLLSENGDAVGESDIILYIQNTVEACRNGGASKIVLNMSDGILNEDNLAALVEGIDVICIKNNEKTSHMAGNTLITYVKDATSYEPAAAAATGDTAPIVEKTNPMAKMQSIVITSVSLLMFALLLYIIIRHKKKNTK